MVITNIELIEKFKQVKAKNIIKQYKYYDPKKQIGCINFEILKILNPDKTNNQLGDYLNNMSKPITFRPDELRDQFNHIPENIEMDINKIHRRYLDRDVWYIHDSINFRQVRQKINEILTQVKIIPKKD